LTLTELGPIEKQRAGTVGLCSIGGLTQNGVAGDVTRLTSVLHICDPKFGQNTCYAGYPQSLVVTIAVLP
jgi:hypothetical protein